MLMGILISTQYNSKYPYLIEINILILTIDDKFNCKVINHSSYNIYNYKIQTQTTVPKTNHQLTPDKKGTMIQYTKWV